MPVVELLIDDIDGIGRSHDAGTRLKVRLAVDPKQTEHNVRALLTHLDNAGVRALFDALFTAEDHRLRQQAEASLNDLHADEDALAERDHEEFERQQAIKQGPALTED